MSSRQAVIKAAGQAKIDNYKKTRETNSEIAEKRKEAAAMDMIYNKETGEFVPKPFTIPKRVRTDGEKAVSLQRGKVRNNKRVAEDDVVPIQHKRNRNDNGEDRIPAKKSKMHIHRDAIDSGASSPSRHPLSPPNEGLDTAATSVKTNTKEHSRDDTYISCDATLGQTTDVNKELHHPPLHDKSNILGKIVHFSSKEDNTAPQSDPTVESMPLLQNQSPGTKRGLDFLEPDEHVEAKKRKLDAEAFDSDKVVFSSSNTHYILLIALYTDIKGFCYAPLGTESTGHQS